uniref:Uncharacterized protein n=1 Tax=viral metagenome TaxID=1070528 RepID=A0A6M3KBC7_9ZZZZ
MILKTTNKLVIDYRAREWCKMPYPDHPKGCPNYDKKEGCPTSVQLVEDYFDLTKDHYFVVVQFDLGSHIEKMKGKHPKWSDRQARCVLYWQGSVNKILKEECKLHTFQQAGLLSNLCPEAMGVNVIKTCKALGLPIKPRPTDTVFKVAMLGAMK